MKIAGFIIIFLIHTHVWILVRTRYAYKVASKIYFVQPDCTFHFAWLNPIESLSEIDKDRALHTLVWERVEERVFTHTNDERQRTFCVYKYSLENCHWEGQRGLISRIERSSLERDAVALQKSAKGFQLEEGKREGDDNLARVWTTHSIAPNSARNTLVSQIIQEGTYRRVPANKST